MVRPAISTPYPLPREREAGTDDKSPKANFSRIDWSNEHTPVAIIHDDVAPLALREFQLNDALLSQREFQIDEGGALTHPAKPETATMHKQPLNSFERVLDELDAIGGDTRPDLAPLARAIRAFGNSQYDPLYMGMDFAKGQDDTVVAITLTSTADLEALRALMAKPQPAQQAHDLSIDTFAGAMQPKQSDESDVGWRCFHCGETFTDSHAATLHFGTTEIQSPACAIDIAEYRAMEVRMRDYNNEDTELHREIASLRRKHAAELRREEEKGYARGLAAKDVDLERIRFDSWLKGWTEAFEKMTGEGRVGK